MTREFEYHDGIMHVEEVPVPDLAQRFGTPLYVYSRTHLRRQFQAVREAFAELDPLICFAVKSNTNAAVIDVFAAEGAGADVVSSGEIFRARQAGIPPGKMVFAGVGKTEEEIEYALREEILGFTVESEPELERISACAVRLGLTGRVDIRVNPDVDPETHKYTSTGEKESKFGVNIERALRAYETAVGLPGVEIAGLHMHIGSPVMSVQPYREALEKVVPICRELKAAYPTFQHLDIGGGLGIPYRPDQEAFDLDGFASTVIEAVRELDLTILLEPGRFLTGNAGILLTEVQYVKENPFKKFIIIDAAMNDLIRPALYEAYHHVLPVREVEGTVFGDLVGPICESGDFLAQERDLPDAGQGDLLAVMGAGAYAYAMASTYNSRGRPAEIMVSGSRIEEVRKRETREDLIRGERIPAWS
jgi:diaminopimelate decarboxylase